MKHLLYTFFLLSFLTTTAQINFEKGYVITSSKERIECYIKNIDWKENPTNIEYKLAAEDTNVQKGNLSNLMEFGIDNTSKYRRFEVSIEKSESNPNFLTNNKNPVWVKQTVFLKLLVEGDATLYVYAEDNLIKYFYETKNTPIEQLIQIKFISSEKNNDAIDSFANSIKTNNQFRQQLYNNVKCESMTNAEFQKISYNKSGLMKHFVKYNSCLGNNNNGFTAKSEKSIVNFKATFGVSMASLSLKDPRSYYNLSTDIKNKLVFSFGAEVEYILPFNKNKWGIFVNPIYQKFDADKSYTNSDGNTPPHNLDHKVKVDYASLEIPFGVRHYMFLNKDSKFFISPIYVINIDRGSELVFNDDESETYKIKPRTNFALGIGYTFKDKFSAELRANIAREILGSYTEWNGKFNTLGVQFSYKLF